MKILQINAVYGRGSTGRMVKEMHEYFSSIGHSSYVFAGDVSEKASDVHRIGNTIDHKIHALLSRIFGLQGYFSTLPTLFLIRQISKIRPDVVHLHNLHNNYINFPLLLRYLYRKDIPTAITLHDCWFYTGHCSHYTLDACNKWIDKCHSCPALHKGSKSWFFDTSEKVFRDKKNLITRIPRLAVIGNSEWITNEARKSFLKNAKKVCRIYNWIDTNVFAPKGKKDSRQALGLNPDDFYVIGVAQGWNEDKGLSVFINLAELLPEVNFILVGEDLTKQQFPQNLKIIGQTQDVEELVTYYSAADVLVNASLQESFGLVSAEALSCGTPIITNTSTANPELAQEGCGWIAEKNDLKKIKEYINHIWKKGSESFSKNCREKATCRFSKEKNLTEYIHAYFNIQ